MEYVTRESIKGLVSKFAFPSPDEHSQDWECEVADYQRYKEFLGFYEKSDNLTDEERFTLMMIVIESTNDAMSMLGVGEDDIANLKRVLLRNYALHENTLNDWADWEQEDLGESHAITPVIRSVIESTR